MAQRTLNAHNVHTIFAEGRNALTNLSDGYKTAFLTQ